MRALHGLHCTRDCGISYHDPECFNLISTQCCAYILLSRMTTHPSPLWVYASKGRGSMVLAAWDAIHWRRRNDANTLFPIPSPLMHYQTLTDLFLQEHVHSFIHTVAVSIIPCLVRASHMQEVWCSFSQPI